MSCLSYWLQNSTTHCDSLTFWSKCWHQSWHKKVRILLGSMAKNAEASLWALYGSSNRLEVRIPAQAQFVSNDEICQMGFLTLVSLSSYLEISQNLGLGQISQYFYLSFSFISSFQINPAFSSPFWLVSLFLGTLFLAPCLLLINVNKLQTFYGLTRIASWAAFILFLLTTVFLWWVKNP